MNRDRIGRTLVACAVIFAVGCTGGEGDEAAEEGNQAAVAALPDTTAEAVWAHLESAGYENWSMWPGKEAKYTGGEPHGMLLTTYLNDVALEALNGTATSMPAGAIIVKENYMPDGMLAAVTVMYKTQNFNPDHNNWFFIKRIADGTVEVGGRGAGCENCHGARADNDYIMTSSLN